MNIFETAPEFVEYDNRRFRYRQTTSKESLTEKLLVQLPPNLINGKSILDLGSCLGAAGHHSLTYGASFYTGVELQEYYVDTSNQLLKKYWDKDQFEIIHQDIEEFLDITIAKNIKYDYVLAAGVIYGFVDVIGILKKIAQVTNHFIMIDTFTVHVTTTDSKSGIILITELGMVKGKTSEVYEYYEGIGSKIDLKALDIVMSTLDFNREEGIIFPKPFTETNDPYNTPSPEYFKDIVGVEFSGPIRYMVRYNRTISKIQTVQKQIKNDNKIKNTKWVFDSSVAERFQEEAETNIPSYGIVIDKCLKFANKHLFKTDKIIDVGSALGYTVDKFISEGYINITGVDNSQSMIDKSLHKHLIELNDKLPNYNYKLILMNWTLHFIMDKESYLKDVYNKTEKYFILTDKTTQSELVKDLYYDFKRDKGLSEEYIKEKEKKLVGVMYSVPIDWYLTTLRNIGFKVDIIHSDFGFTTFLCQK